MSSSRKERSGCGANSFLTTLSPLRVLRRARDIDLELPSGRLHATRRGYGRRGAVVCVPGLAASLHSFDYLGTRLAGLRRQVLALDLRGRGLSEPLARGYGWENHASDVLGASMAAGLERFLFVGHSMGAVVGISLARRVPARLLGAVLIDAVTVPTVAAAGALMATGSALTRSYPSRDAFLRAAREVIVPWNRHWDCYFEHDLEEARGRTRSRFNRFAVLADTIYASLHTQSPHWERALENVPILVLRAGVSIKGADVISESQLRAFRVRVPHAEVAHIEANHYGIVMHPDAATAINAFLRRHVTGLSRR